MMELKVWVDGLQRVVCGATLDTTCQDVVIALAHAMGRTGRFTLIEKWRDNDRPLTPTECPLRVLHKWGEYAAEVRFVLCQADTDARHKNHHLSGSKDKLAKLKGGSGGGGGTGDRPLFPNPRSFAPHPQMQALLSGSGSDVNVKRSLTFSGAHGNGAPWPGSSSGAWLNSSAPTSKFRKTHLGPVPNGDVKRPLAGSSVQQHPPVQAFQRPAARTAGVEGGRGSGAQSPPPPQPPPTAVQQQTTPSQQHPPIPSPRRRHSPLSSQQSGRDHPLRNSALPPSVPTSSSSSSDPDDHHHRQPPQRHHRPQSRTAAPQQPPPQSLQSRGAVPPQPAVSRPQAPSAFHGVRPQSHSHLQSNAQSHSQHSQGPPLPSSSEPGTQSHHPSAHPHPPQTRPLGPQEPHPQSRLPQHTQSQPHPHAHPHSSHSQKPQEQQTATGQPKQRTHPHLPPSHPSHSQLHTVRAPSPQPPPLPSSPPPLRADPDPMLAAERVSLSSPVHSPPGHSKQAGIELEEYDLDSNFPETHRDSNRSAGGGVGVGVGGGGSGDSHPPVSLEYRLEDGVGSGTVSQSHAKEGEHAKLLRLVNMQQERLKTQESQISLINTDITALEEQEKEYEDKLQAIMEELLLHENRQRELEPQLIDLDKVEWENVLDGEKKCEVDLTLKIASCKAQILEHEHKLEDVKNKEASLLSELKAEEEKITQEKERLKEEEARAREEENKTREEISGLQSEFTDLQKRASELSSSVSSVSEELQTVEQELEKKTKELESLEEQLKDENMKDFAAHPVAKEEDPINSKSNSGEAIIKILEGRLSPRPGSVSSKAMENPSSPPFISALSTKNQSGVWV